MATKKKAAASKKVGKVMHEFKHGELKSGGGGKKVTNPKQAIEGITKSDCCRRCSADHGCTITGDACAHPIKVGRIGPRLQGNPTVKAVYKAAREKLGMPA